MRRSCNAEDRNGSEHRKSARKRTFRTPVLRTLVVATILSVAQATPAWAYNHAGAVNWANANYNTYSHEAVHFSDNCTNFVSYALASGGGYKETPSGTSPSEWFMRIGGLPQSWSFSWTVANDQYNFQQVHNPGGYLDGITNGNNTSTGYPNAIGALAGDEIFYDFKGQGIDHTTIMVYHGQDYNQYPYLTGDRVDQQSVPLNGAFWSLEPENVWRNTTTIYVEQLSSGN